MGGPTKCNAICTCDARWENVTHDDSFKEVMQFPIFLSNYVALYNLCGLLLALMNI